MALEDIAMMRAVHGSTVLQPSDANQTAKLVAQMADTSGISFMRTLRPKTPVIYPADEEFPIGGSKVVHSSEEDAVTVVGSGITVHEAVKAADTLAGEEISIRIVDCYSIKPIDAGGIRPPSARRATGWSWPRTTGPRAASARPSSPPWPRAAASPSTSGTWPSPRCRARASPRS
jgi:transketolase